MEFKTKKELTDTLIDYIKNGYSINFSGYIFRVKSGFTAELHKTYYIKDNQIINSNFNDADLRAYPNKYIKKGSFIEFRFEFDAHCRDIENDYWRIDQSILALKCEPYARIKEDIRFGNKHNLKEIIENKLYDELENK